MTPLNYGPPPTWITCNDRHGSKLIALEGTLQECEMKEALGFFYLNGVKTIIYKPATTCNKEKAAVKHHVLNRDKFIDKCREALEKERK